MNRRGLHHDRHLRCHRHLEPPNLLDRTLTQMHKLSIPSNVDWELLVVNNNCTDQTDTVIAKHEKMLPIRRLFEATPGWASARNHAVAEARGELIVWTDDDVLVDQEWLAAYHDAAARWPDAGYFGGLIEPWFERSPPPWMLTNRKLLEGVLAIRDFGPEEHYLSDEETPWTANMALQMKVFGRNRFDPALGVTKNGGYLSGGNRARQGPPVPGCPRGLGSPGPCSAFHQKAAPQSRLCLETLPPIRSNGHSSNSNNSLLDGYRSSSISSLLFGSGFPRQEELAGGSPMANSDRIRVVDTGTLEAT